MTQLGCTARRHLQTSGRDTTPRPASTRTRCCASRRAAGADRVPQADADPATSELVALDCEVLIPAALGGTIHAANADSVRARIVIEGANNPTTPTADEILTPTGVLVIPDVLANAGGVVVSYFEWVQNLQHSRWDEHEVNNRLGARMRRAYREIEQRAAEHGVPLRVAAYELAIERVLEAIRLRGYGGYA